MNQHFSVVIVHLNILLSPLSRTHTMLLYFMRFLFLGEVIQLITMSCTNIMVRRVT